MEQLPLSTQFLSLNSLRLSYGPQVYFAHCYQSVSHECIKHIDIDYGLVSKHVERGSIRHFTLVPNIKLMMFLPNLLGVYIYTPVYPSIYIYPSIFVIKLTESNEMHTCLLRLIPFHILIYSFAQKWFLNRKKSTILPQKTKTKTQVICSLQRQAKKCWGHLHKEDRKELKGAVCDGGSIQPVSFSNGRRRNQEKQFQDMMDTVLARRER